MTHPNSEEGLPKGENPFTNLKISENDLLNTFEGRYVCDICYKSRKFFCYTCYTPHPDLKDVIPFVKLPLKIDIIKHKQEIDGKSTAAHAAILSSEDVKVYTFPDIPSYDNPEEQVVLIFPSQTALDIPQLFGNELLSANNVVEEKGIHKGTLMTNILSREYKNVQKLPGSMPIHRAIFIDSTWNQSRSIYKDDRIRKLPCVILQNRISQFWRHQKGSPRWYLATIEAIHQFVLEMHLNAFGVHPDYRGLDSCFVDESLMRYQSEFYVSSKESAYNGQYDNLLYFFEYMYKLIHTYYDHEQLYAYKRRMN